MRKYGMSICGGQSNELGSGPAGTADRVAAVGAPYIDPSTRGWWATCIESAARRGVWLTVLNTAVATTSLADSWVGRCRAWVSGLVVVRGSYCTSDGALWRCGLAAGSASASTVAPTGTEDVTGADSIPWVYVEPASLEDVDGAIYASSSDRFDPNGYVATAISAVNGKPGYDELGVYTSIGQTDHTVSTTQAQYREALTVLAGYVTGLGLRHWIGMTCAMSGADAPTIAAREATFQNVLLPARESALMALARNPLVSAGADLRTDMGVLSATAIDTEVGLNNSDYLHLTSAGYDSAGLHVDRAFAAGGW